mmetsp:Transcript_22192/g.40839  ORF Transcript_22192/g.40839 Transcript_22192/m.40839 type:complete len:105 (-) Transcript_22192:33-347(-)
MSPSPDADAAASGSAAAPISMLVLVLLAEPAEPIAKLLRLSLRLARFRTSTFSDADIEIEPSLRQFLLCSAKRTLVLTLVLAFFVLSRSEAQHRSKFAPMGAKN